MYLIYSVRSPTVYLRHSDIMRLPLKVHIIENHVHRSIVDASVGGCGPKMTTISFTALKTHVSTRLNRRLRRSCEERRRMGQCVCDNVAYSLDVLENKSNCEKRSGIEPIFGETFG